MLVKCPKCRLRFDVPAADGITELHCNCPRCGTPFTFSLPQDTAQPSTSPARKQTGRSTQPASPGQPDTSASPATPSQPTDASTTKQSPLFSQSSSPASPISDNIVRRRMGCLKHVALMLAALLVIAVVAITLYREVIGGDITSGLVSNGADSIKHSTLAVAKSGHETNAAIFPGEKENPTPEWVQGEWYVETDFGTITLVIDGDHITETSDGGTSRGTCRVGGGLLVCNFGDGETFTYRLDTDRHLIDAGEGLLMRKRH